jgi:hypothetical protein
MQHTHESKNMFPEESAVFERRFRKRVERKELFMTCKRERDHAVLPAELAVLSEELERSFFAERTAMNAGLIARIKENLPKKTSAAARAFRLLGAVFLMMSGAALLLMYQLLYLLHLGPRAMAFPPVSRLTFYYAALFFFGGVIAWTANRIGAYLWLKVYGAQAETENGGGAPTPMKIAVWMRAAALLMVVIAAGGLWSEMSVMF